MSLSLLLPVYLPKWTVSQKDVVLEGYQMYAVDNWLLDRKLVPILVVHTGDSAHKITVSALSPPSQTDWDSTLSLLRRHAKPKETPYGTLLVTSLAQFRSDYTIVQIPGGNLESAKQQLYTNINLLRMGCSGRSGLTLEEPSDTTKDRFISTYMLPDNHLDGTAKVSILFNDTVLELVKLIQISLHIFGHYASSSFDGLLCDSTVDGLQQWVKEVGVQLIDGLDPMERIADPTTVASLLSLVLAARNRLAGLGGSTHTVPKDPFLQPHLFIRAITAYIAGSHSHPSLTSQMMHTMSSKSSSHASHSLRQSISHSSHGGSPHIPTPSIPAFLKDHLPHGNGSSAEATHHYTHSLPIVPTIHSSTVSPPNSTTTSPSAPNASRISSAPFSSETLGGTSMPRLALTIPTPPASGFHTPVSVAQERSNHTTFNISPITADSNMAFPSMDNPAPEDTLFLTRSVIETVFSAYDTKLLKISPEVRRAVRKEKANREKNYSTSREDDGNAKDGLSSIAGLHGVAPRSHLLPGGSLPLASGLKAGLTGTLASSLTGGGYTHAGAASILMPISDLEEFIDVVVGEISSYDRRGKEEKKDKKGKGKGKEERKDREKDSKKDRDKKEADSLSSSSSDGLVDLSRAAKKVKAKVKGRSVDKLLDPKADDKEAGEGYDSHKKERKAKDYIKGGVGGLIFGLWTGRIHLVVKLREKMEERAREQAVLLRHREDGIPSDGFGSGRSWHRSSKSRPSLWSDGETDPYVHDNARAIQRTSLPAQPSSFGRRASISGAGVSKSRYNSLQSIPFTEKSDGRSTEEEGPGILGTESFGMLWARGGSKVRGKLESWAGLSKIDNKLTKQKSKTHSGTMLMPHAESNVVDLSPTPSPAASPPSPSFVPGIPPSPPQHVHSPPSSPSTTTKKGKLVMSSFGSVSPFGSQAHLPSQPHSPLWHPDDDDDLLSSGQVSPVGYGSGFGFDSGTEDPRTPKPWSYDYFTQTLIKSQLGSSFSSSRGSVEESSTSNAPQKRGSKVNVQNQSSSLGHDRAKQMVDALAKHPTRRPWPGNRIPYASRVSSWSDPVSARDDAQGVSKHAQNSSASSSDGGQASEDRFSKEDGYLAENFSQHHRRTSTAKPIPETSSSVWSNDDAAGPDRRHSRTQSIAEGRSARRDNDGSNEAKSKSHHPENFLQEEGKTSQRSLGITPRRRRSFHSLSVYRHNVGAVDTESVGDDVDHRIRVKVLPIDRMRIDVELCGYYLIMWRRAEHLQNVIATLQILTSQLSETNAHMREHHDSHLPDLRELESQLKIVTKVDMENANTMKISQATKSLWYEAEQFRVPDLWRIASPSRQKVLAMREKVLGSGGRRLAQGVHGAHGRFNRLQWTLDGQERLVDSEGKTESEVEEERKIDSDGVFISPPEEDVEDIVEHPSIKPMWLLRFFTNLVANWGASTSAVTKGTEVKADSPPSIEDPTTENEASSERVKVEKAASL
ncbi:hypothetical protein GYMLUDRAFT_191267 [Collybiopsis luxurians FD-317 M1]|nr:hypothetical protein GYMLUDRAFT_191267 [Collybiopsis luxurians FD-317 M1]